MNGVPSLHRITIWIENKKEFENSWQVLLSENVEYIYPAHGKRFKSSDLHKFKAKINKIKLYPLNDNNIIISQSLRLIVKPGGSQYFLQNKKIKK